MSGLPNFFFPIHELREEPNSLSSTEKKSQKAAEINLLPPIFMQLVRWRPLVAIVLMGAKGGSQVI